MLKKLMIGLMSIIIVLVLITGCAQQQKGADVDTDTGADTASDKISGEISSDISSVESIDSELDTSGLDNLEKDLDSVI